MTKASIWHRDEVPGYDKGKGDVGFSRWRVLVMESAAEQGGISESDAVELMNQRGIDQMGLDYEDGLTASQVGAKLAQ